jgi:hypothetical protein
MSETARRIRLLIELKTKTSTAYDPVTAIAVRIERLVDLKQIYFRDGKIRARRGLLTMVARGFGLYERLLFPKRT